MTKSPSIKTTEVEKYAELDLHQLEAIVQKLQQEPPSGETKTELRAVRQAIRQRQRLIKAQVMEFEQTNNHHLLIFDSTDNFTKIAGRSVLFYTLTIADRIHRRYSVKNDTDDYSRSPEGIVSIRALDQLVLQLADINIFPDRKLSTDELHFYKLPRVYNEEQIAKLQDRSRRDVERITSIIVPLSPIPDLYSLLLEFNRLVYHNCKRISETLARETIIHQIVIDANECLISYLNFANAKKEVGIVHHPLQTSTYLHREGIQPKTAQAQNLLNILLLARNLRNSFANIENLRLLHHRELCELLEKIVEIERLAGREYTKQLRKDERQAS